MFTRRNPFIFVEVYRLHLFIRIFLPARRIILRIMKSVLNPNYTFFLSFLIFINLGEYFIR